MFSKPFPAFSARLNAWATAVTCQWLMGPCSVMAVDDGDGQPKAGQGVKVERHVDCWHCSWRFLIQAGAGMGTFCLPQRDVTREAWQRNVLPPPGCATGQFAKMSQAIPLGCRCRYLEESGCASVCLNSCKFPTQRFFMEDMGLPLTMTPNYDDFR